VRAGDGPHRRRLQGIVAVVGWPQAAGAVVYNAASVLRDGLVEQTYRKRELPNYAVFDERRYFDVDPDGGSCVFEVNGIPVGMLICEDLWFAEPLADTVRAGAQLVLVPNASPFERGKHAQRDALLAARTRESGRRSPISTWSAARMRWCSTAPRWWPTATARCTRPRAFVDQWLVVEYDAASAASCRTCGWTTATRAWTRWPGAR
jgi:NAD+ synthase (glutamine-hydrolysing)